MFIRVRVGSLGAPRGRLVHSCSRGFTLASPRHDRFIRAHVGVVGCITVRVG